MRAVMRDRKVVVSEVPMLEGVAGAFEMLGSPEQYAKILVRP